MLAGSAWRTLGQHLRARLGFALQPTLRIERIAAEAMVSGKRKKHSSRGDGEALAEILRHFPGARELAALLIVGWIDAQRELLRRILRDQELIRRNFLRGSRAFCLTAIRPGLSDPHNGGRSVTFLEFGGNGYVIYKPRTCAGEQLWFKALNWLNLRGTTQSFRIPKLLARKNYCWMERLRFKGCRSFAAVREFYLRWGAQTALALLLHACDLHRDNWLAVGKQPILVDAELIGQTNCRSLSVLLETGLLPLTRRDRAGLYKGLAPFDATAIAQPPRTCWPSLNCAAQAPAKYVTDLVRGFEAVRQIFSDRRVATRFFEKIVSPTNQRRTRRTLYRSSAEYMWLLRISLQPRFMAVTRKRHRWLRQACCATAPARAIGLAEAHSLLRCDIPKFLACNKAISRQQFLNATAALNVSERVLRRRVLLGTR